MDDVAEGTTARTYIGRPLVQNAERQPGIMSVRGRPRSRCEDFEVGTDIN